MADAPAPGNITEFPINLPVANNTTRKARPKIVRVKGPSAVAAPSNAVAEAPEAAPVEKAEPTLVPSTTGKTLKIRRTTNGKPVAKALEPIEEIVEESGVVEEALVATAAALTEAPCTPMYDPCTGDVIETKEGFIQRLTAVLREVKLLERKQNTRFSSLTKTTKLQSFLDTIFSDKSISLDDMIQINIGVTQGADIFETFCKLFVIFGGIPEIKLHDREPNFKFLRRIESKMRVPYSSLREAIENIQIGATSKEGMSDVTLIRIKDGKVLNKGPYCEVECPPPSEPNTEQEIRTIVGTVKWYKKAKQAEHYDLEKLEAYIRSELPVEYQPTNILLFLKNKHEFEMAHRRAYRKHAIKYANQIYAWDEDIKPFLQSKRTEFFQTSEETGLHPSIVIKQLLFGDSFKPTLQLQLHQDIIVTQISKQLIESIYPLYCIGVLPRGGKSYIAGGIMRNIIKDDNTHVFFWITSAPTETREQISKDLIQKFNDFDEFEFIEAKTESDIRPATKKYQLWFMSSEILRRLTGKSRGTMKERQSLSAARKKVSCIFFDEAHIGGSSHETESAIQDIRTSTEYKNIPLIFLSATYLKILQNYQIPADNTFIWDYTDVLNVRGLFSETDQEESIQTLKSRFGSDIVEEIFQKRLALGDSYKSLGKPYIDFPDLYFISADFTPEAIDRFAKQDLYDPTKGFSLGAIFALRSTDESLVINSRGEIRKDAWKAFTNVVSLRNLIALFTPYNEPAPFASSEPGESIVGGEPLVKTDIYDPSILGRIDRISRLTESRFRLDEHPTLLFFLPTGGEGTSIEVSIRAFASLLMQHPWWKEKYEVACVVSKENATMRSSIEVEQAQQIHVITTNPKGQLEELERNLHCRTENSRGLIILAGEKLSMGISLPCTDVVFLLNEASSPDDIIQKMYRALTPSINKKSSFIVDLNPLRSFKAIYYYTLAAHKKTGASPSKILEIIQNVYSWDADVFDFSVKKGAESRVQQISERLHEFFTTAQQNKEFVSLENVEKATKTMRNALQSKLTGSFASKIVETLSKGTRFKPTGFSDKAKFELKSGVLIVKEPKDKVNIENESESNGEDEYDEVLKIANFTELATDFVKYLAITSKSEDEFDRKIQDVLNPAYGTNVNGNPLQKNILIMVKQRYPIQGTVSDEALIHLFVEAIRNFVMEDSREVYRRMKDHTNTAERKNQVMKVIARHLTPKQQQKKDFGEVFTPIELVEEMLDKLPASVWKNPNLKWLDPANGIGNFPITVFYKLDEGLASIDGFKDATKRRKHIVENMLYMIELQSNNSRIARNIFRKLCNNCEPNIWTINTFTIDKTKLKSKGWPEEFDIIIGNPPFQDFQKAEGKRGGGDELYMKFVKWSLDYLVSKGYLVFVHPPSWRKPEFTEGRKKSKNAGMFKLMAHDNQLLYLEIHNSADGMKTFKAATRYDFYVLQKKASSEKTTIKDELGKIIELNLRTIRFLPNFNIKNVLKLVSDVDSELCELGKCILYETSAYETRKPWVSSSKSDKFKYPLIHSTPKTGARFYYSSIKDRGFFGIPKVIFGDSGINEPIIDLDGKYGMTQHAMAIVIKNKGDADKLVKFLKSNYFTNILQACMWSSFQIDWRLFTYFKNSFWDIEYDEEELVNTNNENSEQEGGKRRLPNKTRKNRH